MILLVQARVNHSSHAIKEFCMVNNNRVVIAHFIKESIDLFNFNHKEKLVVRLRYLADIAMLKYLSQFYLILFAAFINRSFGSMISICLNVKYLIIQKLLGLPKPKPDPVK